MKELLHWPRDVRSAINLVWSADLKKEVFAAEIAALKCGSKRYKRGGVID